MADLSSAPSPSMNGFPVLSALPVVDSHGRWVAFLLSSARPLSGDECSRLLTSTELKGLCAAFSCLLEVDVTAGVPLSPTGFPEQRLIFLIPAEQACDADVLPRLAALAASGIGLMVKGIPPSACRLPSAVRQLAIPCPGQSIPPQLLHWLTHLPGPHLALGTSGNLCPGRCVFHWLSGHLPGHRPARIAHEPTMRTLLLKLLALVVADADTDEIEALIKRDANLTYQLLRLVNSAAIAPPRPIESLSQAILLLGRRQLQRWLQLLLYVRPTSGASGANPLLLQAALRAASMEKMSRSAGGSAEEADQAFLVGIFSLLDQLFGMPLADLLAPLSLPREIHAALTAHEGVLGQRLVCLLAAENGALADLSVHLHRLAIPSFVWADCLIAACRWTAAIAKEV